MNTLRTEDRLEQLCKAMERYRWNIIGLSEVRRKGIGEDQSQIYDHKLFHSGRDDIHMHGVGFLVHKESLTYVMGCKPISSRVITIRLRAKPFNMTLIQAYAPTTDKSDAEVEEFYEQLQKAYDEVPKGDIVIVLGDWNSKVGTDTLEDWKEIQGPSCNSLSNERGQRLLEFASYNSFVLANTFGVHTKA